MKLLHVMLVEEEVVIDGAASYVDAGHIYINPHWIEYCEPVVESALGNVTAIKTTSGAEFLVRGKCDDIAAMLLAQTKIENLAAQMLGMANR